MSYLNINGHSIPVKINQLVKNPLKTDDVDTTFAGGKRGIISKGAQEFNITTRLVSSKYAHALENLVEGQGHYFSFNGDYYSSKGLSPESNSGTSLVQTQKYANALKISSSGSIVYDFGYLQYTVLLWRDTSNTEVGGYLSPTFPTFETFSDLERWRHFTITSEGNIFTNGLLNTVVNLDFISFNSGQLTLTDSLTRKDFIFDELVVVPYVMTDTMIFDFANLSVPFSRLPRLKISGDVINGKTRNFIGKTSQKEFDPHYRAGTWDSAGRAVSFILTKI